MESLLQKTEIGLEMLPEARLRSGRFEAIWLSIPFLMLAFLWAASRSPRILNSPESLISSPILSGLLGYCLVLLLLAACWLNHLPGRIAPGRLIAAISILLPAFGEECFAFTAAPDGDRLAFVSLCQNLFNLAIVGILTLGLLKTLASSSAESPGVESQRVVSSRGWRDYLMMTKPGLNGLVLVTTFVGYHMASPGPLDGWRCACVLVGAGLVAAGSSVLNQFIERDADRLMRRTAPRPLPSARLRPDQALIFSVMLILAGLAVLTFLVNVLTGFLAAVTLATYAFLYTPLKRINTLSTLAGAISGALPPVLGWTGAGGGLESGALVLFAILFLWQIPHFLAIAWKYRAEYGRAGFQMYSVLDPDGRATGLQTVVYSLALALVSLLPSLLGLAGWLYLGGATLLGLALLALSLRFMLGPAASSARNLFLASIIYLPMLLVLLVVDKTPLSLLVGVV